MHLLSQVQQSVAAATWTMASFQLFVWYELYDSLTEELQNSSTLVNFVFLSKKKGHLKILSSTRVQLVISQLKHF